MAKYKCSVCGYIYDEEKEGKPLLDSKCPVCGMTMVLMEENDSEAAASAALEAAAAPEELAYDPAPVVTPVAVIWTIPMKWL